MCDKMILNSVKKTIIGSALLIFLGGVIRNYELEAGVFLLGMGWTLLGIFIWVFIKIKNDIKQAESFFYDEQKDYFIIKTKDGIEIKIPRDNENIHLEKDSIKKNTEGYLNLSIIYSKDVKVIKKK